MAKTIQEKATDFAFVVGLSSAPIWCGAQAYRAYTSVSGVSLAQYLAFGVSFLIGLTLALEAGRNSPGRVIKQQVFLQGLWALCSIFLVSTVLLVGEYKWVEADTNLGLTALVSVILILTWKTLTQRDVVDPAVRGLISISLKTLPQFILVTKVWAEGGDGFHWTAILMGNISILSRLIPLYLSIKQEGMNRAKWWLLVQDASNELSWASVSVVWILR